MRTLVAGGEVVTATDRFRGDVLIEDGTVRAVGLDLEGGSPVDRVIDATGCLVLPGGVDTHTHFEHMSANGATRTADDFRTGSVAAAHGGTTTFVDFVRAKPGESVTAAYARRKREAAAGAVVDYAFHPIVPAHADDAVFDELVALAETEGAVSWKFFMAYSGSMVGDDVLLAGMRRAKEAGVLPMVHAENGHVVADAIEGLVEAGRLDEHEHVHGHPVLAEVEAIGRATAIADWVGTPVFVVHVSSGPGAEEILELRSRGSRVLGETCPQYLLTSYEDYEDLGFEAAAYVCSPPIRERVHQEQLWQRLGDALGTIGTDHAAFAMTQPDDLPPQKPQGRGNFPRIPNGVPGAEERLMLLWEHGVVAGRMTPSRFVELTATRPAQVFGLYPRKGTIAPGADADLVVWDPAGARTLTAAELHTAAGYTLYEGMRVTASPRTVLSRGEVVVDHGLLDAAAGRGRYVHRSPFDPSTI